MAYLSYHAGTAGKANKQNAKGMVRHTLRKLKETKNHKNKDIDKSKTKFNIDYSVNGKPADEIIEDKLKNEYNNKRKLRKDQIVLREVIAQPSKEVFDGMTIEEKRDKLHEFMGDALPWFMDEFGKSNIVGASGHLDETNPHGHIMIMPMTEDGRVSQTDFFTGPKDLQRQHKDFREHMIKKGWDFETENKYEDIDNHEMPVYKANAKEIDKMRQEQTDDIRELSESPDVHAEALKRAHDAVITGVLHEERKKLKEREDALKEREDKLEREKVKIEDKSQLTENLFTEIIRNSDIDYCKAMLQEVANHGMTRIATKDAGMAMEFAIKESIRNEESKALAENVIKVATEQDRPIKATPKSAPKAIKDDSPEL